MDLENRPKGLFKFYCPLCGHHQKTKTAAGIGLRHHLQFSLATFVFCYFTWTLFGPKGILTYLIFWSITEAILRFQRRSQWVCEECGFDPFLYKQDPNLMRDAVQKYIQSRIDTDEKYSNLSFRNYRSRKELGNNTQDAASNESTDTNINEADALDSTLDVDNDFKLVDPSANIADVHRTETP